jgi:primosomal protein N' (replication factor Y)
MTTAAGPDGAGETLPGLEVARAELARAKPPTPKSTALAANDPVAQVLVDVPLAHLDRPFDYSVPEKDDAAVVPGVRVKVRFAGQDVDGFVVGRRADSSHRLQPLRRVVSAEPVLAPEIADLVAKVAERYAGTRSDVLRLAVPPRHAGSEKRPGTPAPPLRARAEAGRWSAYDGGAAFIDDLAAGATPRQVWSALPGDDWSELLTEAALATAQSGRGVLICVPDHRDVDRLDAALSARLGADQHVVLTADRGPAARYAAFLALRRGQRSIAIGTRAAAFAPVRDLGLVVVWDDGDDLYDEPRAPYPHTREIALLRAADAGTAVLIGGYARSVEAQYLVRTGWAGDLRAPRESVRARMDFAVVDAGESGRNPGASRIPSQVHTAIREALRIGPVLVQTPRAGYIARLACERCRAPALCRRCHGPLRLPGPVQPPQCAWCGDEAPGWRCRECGAAGLRAPVIGDRRTAEELGRAFPGAVVRTSSGDRVLASVEATPALVVATPGAEPVAAGGYAAVCLLDTWSPLWRPDLRAAEEAVRRWANAAALVRPPAAGGRVLAVGDAGISALQALVRWDPAGYADREILDRQSAHLPPASVVATVSAAPAELENAMAALALPPAAEVLGPVPTGEDSLRYVVRVPRGERLLLVGALRRMQGERSTRKLPHVRVQMDPRDLG